MADEVLKMEARMENFISKEMDRIQADLKKFKDKSTEAFQKANRESGSLRKGMKSLKGGFASVAAGMAIGTLAAEGIRRSLRAVANTTREVVDTNVKFERTLSKVKAILRPTIKDFKALNDRARELGESTIFTASQVGEAFVEMGKLGQEAGEIIEGSAAVLDLAALSATDMATAATTAVQTLNQFNLMAAQTDEIVDIMAKSFNTTALDMTKFTNSMKFVGAIGGSTGETVESVTASLGAMADSGIEASLAGTSLRRIMLELADSTSKASKVVNEYDENAETLAEKFQALRKANLDVTATTDMFGLRATTAAQVLIRNADEVDRLTRSFENADGVAEEFANTMLDNVAGATIRLTSAQEELSLTLGQSMMPLLRGYTEGLIKVVKWITANEKATQGFKFAMEQMKIEEGGLTEIILQTADIAAEIRAREKAIANIRKQSLPDAATLVTLQIGLNDAVARQLDLEKQIRVEKGLAETREGGLSNIFKQQEKQRKAERKAALEASKITARELSDEEIKAHEKAKSRFVRQQKEIQQFEKDMANENFRIFQNSEAKKEELQQQILDAEQIFRAVKIEAIANDEIRELAALQAKYDAMREIVGTNEKALTILYTAELKERDNITDTHAERRRAKEEKAEKDLAASIVQARKSLAGSLTTLAKLAISESKASAKAKQNILLGIAIAETAASVVTASKAGWDSAGGNVYAGIALALAAGVEAAAIGAVEIAAISSQKFASGGIVGGNSVAGDKNIISANSGEMVLTKMQQSELFNLANNQGSVNNNTSALQLTINLAGGGTVDIENTDRIVDSMQALNDTLLEANRGGYLEDFKQSLVLEG